MFEGLLIILFCAITFEFQQLAHIIVEATVHDVVAADLKALHVFFRNIDAADAGVFGNIAENIGELEGHAEIMGVFEGTAVLVAENFHCHQAHHRSGTVAI